MIIFTSWWWFFSAVFPLLHVNLLIHFRQGRIHRVDRNLIAISFSAYEASVSHVYQSRQRNILLTIGSEDFSPSAYAILKVSHRHLLSFINECSHSTCSLLIYRNKCQCCTASNSFSIDVSQSCDVYIGLESWQNCWCQVKNTIVYTNNPNSVWRGFGSRNFPCCHGKPLPHCHRTH